MIHLPIHAAEEDARTTSSSSPPGPAARQVTWSPTKIRRIANAALPRMPLPRVLRNLPPVESLQISHIVQWYAHACLLSGKYGDSTDKRVRRRGKQPPSVVEILEHIFLQPTIVVMEKDVTWEQRRRAGQFIAAVYAQYVTVRVSTARELLRHAWTNAPTEIKINATVLMNHTLHPTVQMPGDGDPNSGPPHVAGCLLTWQTQWGRGDDGLAEFFTKTLDIDDLTDLCRTFAPLKESFDAFVVFCSEKMTDQGMHFFSCSMELNSEEASTAKVHLHAFVCLDWRTWGSGQFNKVPINALAWQYQGMIPHLRPTQLARRASPARALQAGLYYQLCPKIGSLFTASNLVLWKVRSH